MGSGAKGFKSLALATAMLLSAPFAHARTDDPPTWDLCPPFVTPQRGFAPPDKLAPLSTYVTADQIESREQRYFFLDGNAKILQNEQWIEATRATYDQTSGEVSADGNVVFGEADFTVTGTSLQFNTAQYRGRVDQASYYVPSAHAQGHADGVQFDNANLIHLNHSSYTTCLGDKPDWTLSAPHVELDRESGFGSATNVVLRFYDVPVFYFPYINFPITAERKSGFLYPSVGYSYEDGAIFAAPYYVNLAPNYDLTLTPRSLWRRGLMLEGQGRYLTETGQGLINFGYLGSDDRYGADRKSVAYSHQGTPAPNLTLTAKASYVSDRDYLHDFGNSINANTTDHLERVAALTQKIGRSTTTVRVRSFQTVDPDIPITSYPYRQMPQLLYSNSADMADRLLQVKLTGEFVNFAHPVLPNARRIDASPGISLPWRRPAGFITPTLIGRYTQYDIGDSDTSEPETHSRALPITTLDTGIFLERDIRFEGNDFLQTLEPRLFYTYIPYKDQSDLPLFDSALATFTFGQMFRPNRFNGADRVGDANQVAAALTTRLYDNETGYERFNLSAGQVFYFEDRRVSLSGTTIDTQPQSNIAAQSNLRLTRRVRVRADSLYDPFADRFVQSGIRMQYKDSRFKLLNVGYRLNYGSTEQTDYSIIWPLTDSWWFAARWLRDYRLDRSLEIMQGLQYSSCCWNMRLFSDRRYDAANDKVDGRIMLEWELKGLASTGESALSLLDDTVAGFAEPLDAKSR